MYVKEKQRRTERSQGCQGYMRKTVENKVGFLLMEKILASQKIRKYQAVKMK